MRLLTPSLIALAALSACTNEPPARLGKPHFTFATEEVTRLWIVRNYEGETAWSVQVARRKNPPPFEPAWAIESAPERISDTLADAAFIVHFLDTLKTLALRSEAKEDSLESLGLKPPRVRLEWTAGTPPVVFHASLGHHVSANARFARYGTFSDTRGVYEVEGAVLRMLDLAADWTKLRYPNVALWEADDVDRIVLSPGHHYERAGSDWDSVRQDRKRPAPRVPALLENLMHQRVLRHLDAESDRAKAARAFGQTKAVKKLTLLTRRGEPQVLEAVSADGKTYARNSLRPNATFEVYPQLLQTLSALTH